MNTTSFTNPDTTNYVANNADLEFRRAMAQLLLDKSQESSGDTKVAVQESPLVGMDKVMKAYMGGAGASSMNTGAASSAAAFF